MLTGLYLPGDSSLHRLGAGTKLILLLVVTSTYVAACTRLSPGTAAALTGALLILVAGGYLACFGSGGVTASRQVAWEQVRPLRWFVVLLLPLQWWASGPARAFAIVGGLVATVAMAGLLTLTTPTPALVDAVVRGVQVGSRPLPPRSRPDPDRVGLLLALTMRSIASVATLADHHRQALAARGVTRPSFTDGDIVHARLTPLVNGVVRHGEKVGEALAARGIDV